MKSVETLEKLKEIYITWLLSHVMSSLIDNLQTYMGGLLGGASKNHVSDP